MAPRRPRPPASDPDPCTPEAARAFVANARDHVGATGYEGLVSTPVRVLVALDRLVRPVPPADAEVDAVALDVPALAALEARARAGDAAPRDTLALVRALGAARAARGVPVDAEPLAVLSVFAVRYALAAPPSVAATLLSMVSAPVLPLLGRFDDRWVELAGTACDKALARPGLTEGGREVAERLRDAARAELRRRHEAARPSG